MSIITLTTDFGGRGPFVGILKGVILGINPDAKIVDLCNDVQPQNIFEASLFLSMSYKYFPPGSIHLAVVDPAVGTSQRPIIVTTDNHYFIGPDNGIFSHIYREPHEIFTVRHLTAEHYFLSNIGTTFHGRDVYAPLAAWFSRGIDSASLGDVITDYVSFPINDPKKATKTTMEGEVTYIDTFGNAITNFNKIHLNELYATVPNGKFRIMCKGKQFGLLKHYAQAKEGEPAALINSFGFVELFIFKSNVARLLALKPTDKVGIMITQGQ
jgi:hypothetical protein